MDKQNQVIQILQEKFGEQCIHLEEYASGTKTIILPKAILAEVVRFLHDDDRCHYHQLTDIIGIDYLDYPGEAAARFALTYLLLNLRDNSRLTLKLWISEDDMKVPSLTGIYRGANWPEREAAEMFGFVFEGHPNLKPLLLCDLFDGKHPLRKDYPLRGMGERESFPKVSRETV